MKFSELQYYEGGYYFLDPSTTSQWALLEDGSIESYTYITKESFDTYAKVYDVIILEIH